MYLYVGLFHITVLCLIIIFDLLYKQHILCMPADRDLHFFKRGYRHFKVMCNPLVSQKGLFHRYNIKLNINCMLGNFSCFLFSSADLFQINYSKTCLKRPLKNRQNKDLNDKW